MIMMAWNYRGKTSYASKIQKIILSLGFSSFQFHPAVGKEGGIVLCWKTEVNVQVTISNANLFNVLIFSDPSHTSWQLTSVYGPTIQSLKTIFWDSLSEIGDA